MNKQVVIRTYPHGWTNATKFLQEYLDDGYHVVFVNKITSEKSVECLEYILEIDEVEEDDK